MTWKGNARARHDREGQDKGMTRKGKTRAMQDKDMTGKGNARARHDREGQDRKGQSMTGKGSQL
jgi:hypothetical protein